MKKLYSLILVFVLLFISISNLFAASYVAGNYTVSRTTATYGAITGTTAIAANWNSNGTQYSGCVSSAIPLGFTFYINGVGYTQCYANGNGYITFGAPSTTTTIQPMATNNGFNASISAMACIASPAPNAAFWGIYDRPTTNAVIYTTQGVAPNRVFTIQWTAAARVLVSLGLAQVESMSFQINLYETSNNILLWYGACSTPLTLGNSNTYTPHFNVGIAGSTTSDCIALTSWTTNTTSGTNTTAIPTYSASLPASGLQFLFTPNKTLAPNPNPINISSYISQSNATRIAVEANNLTASSTITATLSGAAFQVSADSITWGSGPLTFTASSAGLYGPTNMFVKFNAPGTAGPSSGSVTFANAGATSVVVPLNGTANNPVITTSPSALVFSNPAGYTSSSQNISLSAAGLTNNLTVTITSATSGAFQVQDPVSGTWYTSSPGGTSFVITASGTYGPVNLPVQFVTPVTMATYTGTIAVSSSPATTSNVALTGYSTAPPLNGLYNICAACSPYNTLGAAIDALNTRGMNGPVTFNVQAGNAQTAPSAGGVGSYTGAAGGGYVINVLGDFVPTATNTLTIEGNGNTVTANSTLVAGSYSDAIFTIAGNSYVTINNFVMRDNTNSTVANTTNNKTEIGVALVRNAYLRGAQYCTISNNNIGLGTGTAYVNTAGIYSNSNNQFNTAFTAGTGPSSVDGTNSYNTFIGNTITGITSGILLIGNTTYNDLGNIVGGSTGNANTITLTQRTSNMTMTAFNGYVLTRQDGIYTKYNQGFTLDHNTITLPTGGSTNTPNNGIFTDVSNNGSYTNTVTNNAISMTTANAVSLYGIQNGSGGTTAATNSTLAYNNNTVTIVTSSTAACYGIYNTSTAFEANFNSNTISPSTSSSAQLIGIYNTANHTTLNINSNIMGDPTVPSVGFVALNATCLGIYNVGATIGTLSVSSNKMNATMTTGVFYGVYSVSQNVDLAMNSNNIKLNTSSTGYGFLLYNYTSPTNSGNFNSNTLNATIVGPSGTAASSYAIRNQTGSSIALKFNNNNISFTQTQTAAVANNIYGIFNIPVSDSLEMANNVVTINNKGNQVIGVGHGPSTGSSFVKIRSNTIDISQTSSTYTTGNTWYVYNYPSATSPTGGTAYVDSNVFKSTSGYTTSTGAIFLMSNNYCPPAIYCTNNRTSGTISKTGAGAGAFFGYVSALGPLAYSVENISDNNFSNISLNSTTQFQGIVTNSNINMPRYIANDTIANITGGSGTTAAIVLDNVPTNTYVYNNYIHDISGTGTVYGITASSNTVIGSSSVSITGGSFKNNSIFNLSSSGASSTIIGLQTASATTASFNISDNKIYNLSTSGATSPFIYGISQTAMATDTISSNQIYNFTSGASGTPTILGISAALNTSGTSNIYGNNIYNLTPTGTTGNASQVTGMSLLSGTGTYNVYNNFITGLSAANASNYIAVTGINLATGGANWNLYYNTIYLGSSTTLTTAGTNFGVAGIVFPTTGLLTMNNNYIQINATPKPVTTTGGMASCLWRNTSTAGAPATSNFMGNYNIYGVNSGTNNTLYAGRTAANSAQTIVNQYNLSTDAAFNSCTSAYKATFLGSGREASTYTENQLGAPSSGVTVPSGTTYAKNGATTIAIPAITTDYAGTTRPSTPDIGAKQVVSGTAPAAGLPVIAISTPLANSFCEGTTTTLNVTVSSANTVTNVLLYYKASSDATTTIASANNNSVGGWKYVAGVNTSGANWQFTLDYSLLSASLLGTPVTISYFVEAKDNTSLIGIYPQVYSCPPAALPIAAGAAGPSGSPASASSYVVSTPSTFATAITPLVMCGTGNTVLLNINTPAPQDLTIQWKQDLGTAGVTYTNISGATSNNYPATPPAFLVPSTTNRYEAVLTCNAFTGAVQTYTSTPISSTDYSPAISTTTPGSRCGPGSVALSATGVGGVENWYTSSTGGYPIATTASGATFNTPSISSTTTYYVSDSTGGFGTGASAVQTVGPTTPVATGTNAATTITPGYATYGVDFTVNTYPIVIKSLDIFPGTTNTLSTYTISVYNNATSTIVASYLGTGTTSSAGSTPQTVNVGFYLLPGNYRMAFSNISGGNTMYLNTAGGAFPYNPTGNTSSTMTLSSSSGSSGTYYAFYNWKVLSGCMSSPRTPVVATINALPDAGTVTASPAGPCTGGTVTLYESGTPTGSGTLVSYSWSGPSGVVASGTGPSVGNASFAPTDTTYSGYYYLTVTYPGVGCTSTSSVTNYVTVNPAVTPTLSGTYYGCIGAANSTLSASPGGGTWAVTGGGSGAATINSSTGVITGTSTGTVNLQYTTPCGASVAGVYTVSTTPATITGPSNDCLTGGAVAYTNVVGPPGGGSVSWTSGSPFVATITSGGSLNPVSAGATVITYTINTPLAGSCATTLSISITNNSPGTITAAGGATSMCAGATLLLSNATSGGGWSSGAPSIASINASSGLITASTPSGTPVTFTYSTGCGSNQTYNVTVNGISISSMSSNSPVCSGGTLSLTQTTSTVPTSFSWAGPNGFATAVSANPTISSATFAASGTYTFTANSTGCASASRTIFVDVNVTPTVTASVTSGATICVGGSSSLLATPGGSSATTVYAIPYSPISFTASGTYSSSLGTWTGGTDDGAFNVSLPFSFNFYGNSYSSINVSANGYANFGTMISSGHNSPAALPSSSSSTVPQNMIALFWHNLNVGAGGSITYGTTGTIPHRHFIISYNNVPDFGTANANSGQIVLNETDNSVDLFVTTTSSATKVCGVQNSTGTSAATGNGKNNTSYTVSSTSGEGWRFAAPNYTYSWSPAGSLSSSVISNPVSSGLSSSETYSVSISDQNISALGGCPSATSTAAVTVNPAPSVASVTPSASNLCSGGPLTLTAGSVSGGTGSFVSYIWSGPGGYTNTVTSIGTLTVSATPTSTGAYSVVANYSGSGCSGVTPAVSSVVTVTPQPAITSVTPSFSSACAGSSLTITTTSTGGVGTSTYTWSGASIVSTTTSTGTSPVFSPTLAGSNSYLVLLHYDGVGCIDYGSTVTVTTNPNPSASVSPAMPNICQPTTAASIGLSSILGSPTTYSVTWDATALADGGFSNISAASLSGSSVTLIYNPSGGAGSFDGTLTLSNGTCTSAPYPVHTIVHAEPHVAVSAINTPCVGYAGSIVFTGTDSASVAYKIDGGSTINFLFAGTTHTLSTGAITSAHNYLIVDVHNPVCTTMTDPVIGTTITITPTPMAWVGGTGGAGHESEWNRITNWSCGFVPTVADDVQISAAAFNPEVPSAFTATTKNLTVSSGGVLVIDGTGEVDVKGSYNNSAQVLGAGKVILNGGSSQTITGIGTTNNLELDNSAGATINTGSRLIIGNTITITSGTLTTNDSLELASTDTNATARIAEIPSSGAAITGQVKVDQYVMGGYRRFRFFSHPFSDTMSLSQLQPYIDITGPGGTANGFRNTASNSPSAFRLDPYTENSSMGYDPGWKPFTSINTGAADSNKVHPGQGIRLLIRGAKGEGLGYLGYIGGYTVSPTTFKMMGNVNQGNVSIPLAQGASPTIQSYNMVGNPYASPVDMGTVIWNAKAAGQVMGGAFFVFDPSLGAGGQFVPVNLSGSPIPYYVQANTCIQVQADHDGAHIDFTESDKSATTSNYLFKAPVEYTKLNVYDEKYHMWDMLQFDFNDKATDENDKMIDAAKPMGIADFNFYSQSADNQKLAIDSRPFAAEKIIQLGITSGYQQTFIIRADNVVVPTGGKLVLHDKLLEKYVDLNKGTEYAFTISKDKATQGDRFELGMKSTAPAPVKPLTVSMTPNPTTDDVKISFTSGKKEKVTVRVMDISGVSIYSKDLGEQQNGTISVPLSSFASGIYMVELTQGDEKTTQRLVKE